MADASIADNSLLKLLFEKSLTPIAYMDLNYNFIHVNQGYATAGGKSVDYFVGKITSSFIPTMKIQKYSIRSLQQVRHLKQRRALLNMPTNPKKGLLTGVGH